MEAKEVSYKIRKDFNPEKTLRHIAEMRVAINRLTAVDEVGGLPGGKETLDEGYRLCKKLEKLVKEAIDKEERYG